jgi:exopolyphosphatase/guanosine-5'-triphosphate,3'-diphosphate pyrophosphatase
LLVAGGSAEAPRPLLERATITRLGQGVDATGRLAEESIDRTVGCLASYATALREQGALTVDVVCTSAARDAVNGAEFLERARHVLGVPLRIIGGDEEARLTFEGALTGIETFAGGPGTASSGATRASSSDVPVTVFDVGGGSTEVIHGTASGEIFCSVSRDVGSVRLTERHIRTDPPLPEELARVRDDVERALCSLPRPAASGTLVGVAGTVTTLSAIDQSLSVYDSSRVHGSRLTRAAVIRILDELAQVPLAERRRITGLEPARADVIIAGTVLVRTVLDWAGRDALVVSDRGVRWGLARRLLALAPSSLPPPSSRAPRL